MSSLSLTQQWLRQNTQSYAHPDVLYAHVDAALARYPSVRPKTDIYTYDDGRTQLLLCLHGLLPISYRGASYNIPIAVWITRDYPRQPPIAYVVPTSDMLVRKSQHIDVSGRCEIDYIANWARKSEGCSTLALLEAMQDHFSREPPVYAKPKNPASPPPQAHPRRPDTTGRDYSARPPPPPPGTRPPAQLPTQSEPATPIHHNDRPPLPTKPTAASPLNAVVTPSPGAIPSPALGLRPPPPLPPHDAELPQYRPPPGPPRYSSSPAWAPGPPRDPAHVPRYASPDALTPPPPPPPLSHPQPQSHPPPPPPPFLAPQSTPAYNATLRPAPSLPPPDLLDAEDTDGGEVSTGGGGGGVTQVAAPPRPPNPELVALHARVHAKLSTELASLRAALALDAERLRAHQADLLAGGPALRDEMARLEAVRDVCRGVAARVGEVVDRAERNVGELRRKGEPGVDELVCATTIVHNQLINLVAEDNAIEDTIYHLHRALNAGRIDLERFLRTTRALAEEQFMKRALAEKILGGGARASAWA